MAYPSLKQIEGSQRTPLSGLVSQRSQGGKLRQQILYDSEEYEFVVRHLLNSSDWSTLWTHYTTNKGSSFTLTWDEDSSTHTVMYTKEPVNKPLAGGWHDVTVYLGTT